MEIIVPIKIISQIFFVWIIRKNFLYTNDRITYFRFISFEIGEDTSVVSIMVVFLGLHRFFPSFWRFREGWFSSISVMTTKWIFRSILQFVQNLVFNLIFELMSLLLHSHWKFIRYLKDSHRCIIYLPICQSYSSKGEMDF